MKENLLQAGDFYQLESTSKKAYFPPLADWTSDHKKYDILEFRRNPPNCPGTSPQSKIANICQATLIFERQSADGLAL